MSAMRENMRRRTYWLCIPVLAALVGCQKGSQENMLANPIDILTVDVTLDATDNRTTAVVTADFAPPGSPQSGTQPISITETVNTAGQTVVPVDLSDDAVPPNRYANGRIEIQ